MNKIILVLITLLALIGGAFFFIRSSSAPTIIEYETCRNINCTQECVEGDSECYAASKQFSDCYNSNEHCQSYQNYWAVQEAHGALPTEFYQCWKQCDFSYFQKIGSYEARHSCNKSCAK